MGVSGSWYIFLGFLSCVHPENGHSEPAGFSHSCLPGFGPHQNVTHQFEDRRDPWRATGRYTRDVKDRDPPSADEQFKEYYRCIVKKNREYESVKNGGEVILIEEGQRVEMTCDLCVRPDQQLSDYVIGWKRVGFFGRDQFVKLDKEKFQLVGEQSLVIHDVQVEDSGQYYCEKNGVLENMYVVDVVLSEARRRVVERGLTGESAAKDQTLKSNNLQLTTVWSSWSACDKCGHGGNRRRLGTCTVSKIDKDKPVKPFPVDALDMLINIPCRSSFLPASVKNIPVVVQRESEVMIGRCFIPCPTLTSKIVTDTSGQIVEALQVEEKYYDVGKTKPKLLPLVVRKSIYETLGKSLVLSCPHKSKGNVHIRWQNGTNVINPITINKATSGRVRIDVYSRLHIKNLRYTDTRTFSCWVQSRLVATVKLVIIYAKDNRVKDYIVYAGCGLVALTMFVICVGVVKNRDKKTLR